MSTDLLDTPKNWLIENIWLLETALVVALTVAAFVLWGKVQQKIVARAQITQTPWDNVLVKALGAPMSLLIVLLGLHHIVGVTAIGVLGQALGGSEVYPAIREAIIVIIVFWMLLRFINGMESHARKQKIKVGDKEINTGTTYAVFQTLRAVIFLAAGLTALEAFGVSVSGLLAFGGVGGVLIGFAAKDTLANFFSGLLIFWERPFVVGDWIRRPDANIEGVVENIGWRMTQIRTFDHRPLYVPNSLFFNSVIENPQRMTNRRIYEYMGLRYQDIKKLPIVLQDIRTLIDEHEDIDQDKIKMVNFDRYGSSSLDFFVYAMTKTIDWGEYHRVKEDILLQIAAVVQKHGCEFAFPTRTVHHRMHGEAPPPPLPH